MSTAFRKRCRRHAVALAALAAAAASAQQAEPLKLDAVTVTGARAPKALSDLSTSVSIVEPAELREQLTVDTNILEALDVLVPGLTVSRSEFRSGCSTNIRGRPAQFLINGVPTNDNLRRSNCGSLFGISPFAIERIEVLRGATSLFGAGASGGVINLLTRRAASEALEIDTALQWSVNPHEASGTAESTAYLGAGQRRDGWDYYFGGAFHDYGARRNPDGGLVPGAEFQARSLNASLGADLGPGKLRFTAVYNNEDPGRVYATDFTQVAGERFADNIFEVTPPNPYAGQARTRQTVLSLSYDLPEVLGHDLSFALYSHRETLIQRSAEFFAGDVFYFDSDAENERRGLRSTATRAFDWGSSKLELTYGLDLLRQSYYRPQVDPSNGAVIGYVSPEVTLDSRAVFVQPQWRSGPWLLSGGVRHERFEGEVGNRGYDPAIPRAATPGDTPDFSLTLWNAGFVYDLDPALQLFGGFSQGAEISEFGRAARGAQDPSLINLDGATSDQIELGLRGRRGPVDFSVAVFRSESDKAASLQADPSCAGQPLCPLIPLRLAQKIHGLELTADWQVNPQLNLGTLVTYQKGRFTEPGAPSVPFGADTLSPPRATLYAEFEPLAGWRGRVQATRFGSTDEYDAAEQAAGYRNTDSLTLVDVSASLPLGPGRLSLGIANLFNREYVNVTNQASGDFFYYLSEGRRATLTWQARF
ncbi:MAG TPA: TonB-dependent receptor [Methylibium sp.]|nr:TonB-dependent receptor [Methylibium sp.]